MKKIMVKVGSGLGLDPDLNLGRIIWHRLTNMFKFLGLMVFSL